MRKARSGPLAVLVCVHVVGNLPSDSSSSSSASFSRTSAGRVIARAGVGSNIIVSSPVELLSAMVVQHEGRTDPLVPDEERTMRPSPEDYQ